jgi:hypothetical protein
MSHQEKNEMDSRDTTKSRGEMGGVLHHHFVILNGACSWPSLRQLDASLCDLEFQGLLGRG